MRGCRRGWGVPDQTPAPMLKMRLKRIGSSVGEKNLLTPAAGARGAPSPR